MAYATTTYFLIAATAATAAASYTQGRARKKMGAFNSKIASNNAVVETNNSRIAQQEAFLAADKRRRLASRIIGQQTAAAGKSGTSVSGSVSDIMLDSSLNIEEDIINDIYRGNIQSVNSRVASSNFKAESSLSNLRGEAAYRTGIFEAGSSIASGFGAGLRNPSLNSP